MASATPWEVLPHAEAFADTVEDKIDDLVDDGEKVGDRRLHASENTHPSWATESIDDKETVHELARAFTQSSLKRPDGSYINPFESSDNPLLDPTSGKFSARAWTKNLVGIQSRDPERYPGRTAGVAYKSLSAHGFGQPTDYQKTFGNYPLEFANLFKQLIGQSQKTKIQILRDFDGLVKSGEMLVVLGRPGSGCSTLLKTISGEIDGFFVSDDSYINYQGSMYSWNIQLLPCSRNFWCNVFTFKGSDVQHQEVSILTISFHLLSLLFRAHADKTTVPMKTMHNDFRGECIYQAEVDIHFPQLTVGQTLDFAARARGKVLVSKKFYHWLTSSQHLAIDSQEVSLTT